MNSRNYRRRFRDRLSGPATLISEGCRITGNLAGTGDFMISGEVEGDCNLSGTVSITRSGRWKGSLRAGSVYVAGTVDGDIEASGRVEIADSGRVSGSVSGVAIAVAEGAVVEGTMQTSGRSDPVTFREKRQRQDEPGGEPAAG